MGVYDTSDLTLNNFFHLLLSIGLYFNGASMLLFLSSCCYKSLWTLMLYDLFCIASTVVCGPGCLRTER